MSDSLQSSSSPSSSVSLHSSSSSTSSTFTTPTLQHLLHLQPSSTTSPSPLVSSLQSILSEFQRVDSERASLLSRLSQLEQQAKDRDDEVRVLKKQIEVLQYGVRCERAMRMSEGSRGRGPSGVPAGGRGKENMIASMREEKKAAGEVADEKEQLLLKTGNDSQPAVKAANSRSRGKATPLQPNYFTLPSRLPASPMSARTMLMWKDYIQSEGSKLDLDLSALKEGKRSEEEADGKQSGRPHMFPLVSPSQAAAVIARPRSPALSTSETTAAASSPRVGILGGKAKGAAKKVKKLQFKEEVEKVETGNDGDEAEENTDEKVRKSITSIFTPPADDKDSTSSPTAALSPASSSASPSSRTASSSSPTSSSSSSSKSVFSTLASSAAYKQLRPKLTLRHHVAGVRAIAFDSSASLSTSAPATLVSASDDCTVQVWNLSTQLQPASSSTSSLSAKKQAAKPIEPISTFRHTHPVLSVALHLESSRLVVGTVGGGVEVWEATSTGVPGGLYGATVGWTGKLGGWQAGGAVWSVVMEEKGDVVICASADGNVYVYNMTAIGSAPLHTIPPPCASSRPTSLTYLSSEQVVAGYTGGEIAIIEVSTGSVVTRSTTASYITSVAANAFHLFTGHADGTIQLHDPHTLTPSSAPVKAHTDSVTSVSCHPTSSVLASCGHDETVRVWDVRDGGMRVLQCLEPHSTHRCVMDEAVHCVRWNEDGRLASSGADGMIKVYV